MEFFEMLQQRIISLKTFAKPETRVEHQTFPLNSAVQGCIDPVTQFALHQNENIRYLRELAPLLRPAAHVHQYRPTSQGGKSFDHLPVPAESAHVVDDLRSRLHRR